MAITKELFLPQGGKMILPSGKIIFVSDIGNFKLRLSQKNPVTWLIQDKQGNKIGTGTTSSMTPVISNAFLSKSSGKIFIEFDSDNKTARTELNKENFYGTELESLPSVEQREESAQIKADEAIEAQGAGLQNLIKIGIYVVVASSIFRLFK